MSGIVLGTLNVKNIETNIVYVEKLLKNVIFYFCKKPGCLTFSCRC